MPLNLSNRDQNSGHLFYNRRLKAAITRFSVRMKHDDRKQTAAVALSIVFVLIGVGWMALLNIVKPTGLVGDSNIIGNRETGQLYAKINGRLYPALNLTSARLVTGSNSAPTWVKGQEINKYPTGPLVGIPGIPDALPITNAGVSAWTVCDTAGAAGTDKPPVVTSIAGPLSAAGRAAPLAPNAAVLVTHFDTDQNRDRTYVLWGNNRSEINPDDRALTFNLGLDHGLTEPVKISNALFDAIPATEPLRVPVIPDAGADSDLMADSKVGTVFESRDATGTVTGYYVLLPDGVQKITSLVADMIRTANATDLEIVTPDVLVNIPEVDALQVEYYPDARFEFVDTAANPVTCLAWQKGSTDRQASMAVFSGRGLPVVQTMDTHIVQLVRNDRRPQSVEADQTLVLPGAANFVAITGGAAVADTRETLFWLSPQGVRYGIEYDQDTLNALGMDPAQALQAPWPLVRTFAAGPAIGRASAAVARDTILSDADTGVIPDLVESSEEG